MGREEGGEGWREEQRVGGGKGGHSPTHVTHKPVTGSALVLTSMGRSSSREVCLMLSSVSWAYSMQSERTVSSKPGRAGGEEEERVRREEGEGRREEGGNRKTERG